MCESVLQSLCMYSRFLRPIAYLSLAYLLIIPSAPTQPGSLREGAVTYRTLGYEAQQRGEQATALSWYRKAAALDPSYATPHNDAGILLEQAGRLEEAQEAYHHAVAVDPNYLEAHANLAMLSERLGDTQSAIVHWRKRLELGDPANPWTIRARERLIALGALEPGQRGSGPYAQRQAVEQELQAHAQSREEFRDVTGQYGNWPRR